MLVLGLDLETTGLDTAKDRIIEVGAVLWDTDLKAPVSILSEFVRDETYPELTQEITEITGITQKILDDFGRGPKDVLEEIESLAVCADAIVAHNGTLFDRPMLENELVRNGGVPLGHLWVDTAVDIDYPAKITTRKLTHLAAEHGFLNPFSHRAFSDVLTMLAILSKYDINEVIRSAENPSVTLVAVTKKPWEDPAPQGEKEVDKAKARGYRWDGERKVWSKTVKAHKVAEEKSSCGFPVLEG